MSVYDLIVVGCGPAGSAAARQAADAGLSVLVLDARRRLGEPRQCAEMVPQRMPVDASLLAASTCQLIDGLDLVVEGVQLDQSIDAPGVMLDRPSFDRHLAAVAADSGALLRLGRRVRRLVTSNGAAEVHTLMASSGLKETFKARAVIGADGPRSTVAASLGCSGGELMVARQMTVPLVQPLRRAMLWFERGYCGGYGWLFPKGREANVGLGLPWSDARRLNGLLAEHVARLDRRGLVRREGARVNAAGAIPSGGWRSTTGRHALLVGDAAGLTNPLTGAGVVSALISGQLAGQVVADALRGRGKLADYDEEIALALPLRRFAHRRQTMLERWDDEPLETVIREAWIDAAS